MTVHERHQRVRLALDDSRSKILSMCSIGAHESLALGIVPEALEAVLNPIRQIVSTCFHSLNEQAPLIKVSDSWDTEHLHAKLSQLQAELSVHRRRISRHKSQFYFLADRYRKLRHFHETFKENYWSGLREVLFQLQAKGISTQFLNRYANQYSHPDDETQEDGEEKKPKDWFLEFDDDLDGLHMLDEEEVAAQITEAVLRAKNEGRLAQQALEEELQITKDSHAENIVRAVEEAISEYKEEKALFAMMKIEYENRIDELQQQLDTTKSYVTERMEKVKQVRERTLQGISRELQSAQMNSEDLQTMVESLEDEVEKLRESEELLKLDVLNANMAHKKDSFHMRKQIQLLRTKLEDVEPLEAISKRVAKPLTERINHLETSILEHKQEIQKAWESKDTERDNFIRTEKLLRAQVEKLDESQGVVKTVSAKLLRAEKEVTRLSGELSRDCAEKEGLTEKVAWQSDLVDRLNESVAFMKKQLKEAERKTGFVARKMNTVTLPKTPFDSPSRTSEGGSLGVPGSQLPVDEKAQVRVCTTETQTDTLITGVDRYVGKTVQKLPLPPESDGNTATSSASLRSGTCSISSEQRDSQDTEPFCDSDPQVRSKSADASSRRSGEKSKRMEIIEQQLDRSIKVEVSENEGFERLKIAANNTEKLKEDPSSVEKSPLVDKRCQTDPVPRSNTHTQTSSPVKRSVATITEVPNLNPPSPECIEQSHPAPSVLLVQKEMSPRTQAVELTSRNCAQLVDNTTSQDVPKPVTHSRQDRVEVAPLLSAERTEITNTSTGKPPTTEVVDRNQSEAPFLTTKSLFPPGSSSATAPPDKGFLTFHPSAKKPTMLKDGQHARPLCSERIDHDFAIGRKGYSDCGEILKMDPDCSHRHRVQITMMVERAVQTEASQPEVHSVAVKSDRAPTAAPPFFLRVHSASVIQQRKHVRASSGDVVLRPQQPSRPSIPQQHRASTRSLSLVPTTNFK